MLVNCPYCSIDTGGNHEIGCPNYPNKDTIAISKQTYNFLIAQYIEVCKIANTLKQSIS